MNTILPAENTMIIDGVTIRNSIASLGALMEAIDIVSELSQIIVYDPFKNEDIEYHNPKQSNRIYLEDGVYASYTGCGSFVTFYPTAKEREEAKKGFSKLEEEIYSTKKVQIPTISAEFELPENSQMIPCLYLEAEERGEGETGSGMIYGVIVNPKSYVRNKREVKMRRGYNAIPLQSGTKGYRSQPPIENASLEAV
jgi:hypothetical protein